MYDRREEHDTGCLCVHMYETQWSERVGCVTRTHTQPILYVSDHSPLMTLIHTPRASKSTHNLSNYNNTY